MFTIGDCKCAKELIELDFSERLLISPEDCKTYLQHCKDYDMKFLKGSYGTIVHNAFDEYFEYISPRNDEEYEIQEKITCGKGLEGDYRVEGVKLFLDHTNLFKSKIEDDVYIVTSSPYYLKLSDLMKGIKNYPYGVYVIHSNLLDYHGFLDHNTKKIHPLFDLNFAFTNATTEQMQDINQKLWDDLKLFVGFDKISEGE